MIRTSMWDVETGDCRRILRGHTHEIRSLAITSGDRYLVSGSADNTILNLKLATGTYTYFPGPGKEMTTVSMTRIISGFW